MPSRAMEEDPPTKALPDVAQPSSMPAEPISIFAESEEYALFQRLKTQTETTSGPSSIPEPAAKRSKSADRKDVVDAERSRFLQDLASKNIELGDMDPSLQHALQSSAEARDDFRKIHLSSSESKYFNTETGAIENVDLTKKRPFSDCAVTVPENEQRLSEAMLSYHQTSVLPNLQVLQQACEQFDNNTQDELFFQQLRNEMMDSRLRSLEASKAQRCLLIKGLPATGFNKAQLDYNLNFWLTKAEVPKDQIVSMTNHVISTNASIMRLEFVTEGSKRRFQAFMRSGKQTWRISGQDVGKAKTESDLSADERLAVQPFYALMDIIQSHGPRDLSGEHGQLQTDRNTLQIWPCRESASTHLLSQVVYLLDSRFPRRYLCCIFLHKSISQAVVEQWMPSFTERVHQTLLLIQGLQRAAVDRTTFAKYSFDRFLTLPISGTRSFTFRFPSSSWTWATP